MHTYRSASLKQTTDLAYYHSNQSVEIAIQGYKVNEGQVSDITVAMQANTGMPVEFLAGAKNVAPIALAGPLLISMSILININDNSIIFSK